MTVRRARRKALSRGRLSGPVLITMRGRRSGSRSLYHQAVADRPIDRQAWAQLVADLIASETGGNKAAFARRVGVDPKTINHWLAGNVDVSEASVRRVADALGRRPLDLLVAVGYYRADEVGAEPGAPPPLDPDVLLLARQLADPSVSDEKKATIRATLRYLAGLADRTQEERPRRRRPAS
jgi:transcriptional regulator with XRE-family HTH domain